MRLMETDGQSRQAARPQAKLVARLVDGGAKSTYLLHFAVPDEETAATCAPAKLVLGDGAVMDLGLLCAPTVTTWSRDRVLTLAEAVPVTDGQEAVLVWGTETLVPMPESAAASPEELYAARAHVEVNPSADGALVMTVKVRLLRIPPRLRVRIDGGASNREVWANTGPVTQADADGQFTTEFGYPKPGDYTLSVDLIDPDGFWVASLAEHMIMVAPPIADPIQPQEAASSQEGETQAEVASVTLPAWLPFRYVRPLWAWARTYTRAGGSTVSRNLALGTYLAIRQEVMSGGQLWYQTGGYDWIPAAHVALITPSDLRGVPLSGATPEPKPEPEPEPGDLPRGVVTATVLNVRSGPGTNFGVIDQLRYGAEVIIYAQQIVTGTTWYRIGVNRWVHGGWIRLLANQPPGQEPVRRGVVTADVLNVRARPGVSPDNPPVDRLLRGASVLIFEDTTVSGAVWYRIGVNRWVHSAWIQLVAGANDVNPVNCDPLARGDQTAQTANNPKLPVGWVVTTTVNVRAAPTTAAALVGTLSYKARIDILEERVVAGQRWYRIGAERWVYAANIGAARFKARPSAIRANERWVGVNLTEQTVVAYEGDRPVYAALTATGLPRTPTVRGIFRTWWRLVSRRMAGGSAATGGYYYLEEVPWTCYFYSGYALHAAYWHDAFGRPRSHGCVNLSMYDAWWIFRWSEAGGANSPAVYVYAE